MKITFVGGFARTGTTMLQSILCSTPASNPMIGEAVFMRALLENYWRGKGLFDEHSRYYFDDQEDLRRFCGHQVDEFLDRTAARFGNPAHLILKHPQLTPMFPLLHELRPDVRFVVSLRSPLDTVASGLRARDKGAAEFRGTTPASIAQEYVAFYTPCLGTRAASFETRTLYVKYEALVADPADLARRIGAELGLDLSGFDPTAEPGHSERDFAAAAEQARPLHSGLYGKGISADRVGRHDDVLSGRDAEQVSRICSAVLTLYRSEAGLFRMATTPAGAPTLQPVRDPG